MYDGTNNNASCPVCDYRSCCERPRGAPKLSKTVEKKEAPKTPEKKEAPKIPEKKEELKGAPKILKKK